MRHQRYIGDEHRLKGEKALVRDDPESKTRGVLAQFDALYLPESHGWWSFYSYEFENIKGDK